MEKISREIFEEVKMAAEEAAKKIGGYTPKLIFQYMEEMRELLAPETIVANYLDDMGRCPISSSKLAGLPAREFYIDRYDGSVKLLSYLFIPEAARLLPGGLSSNLTGWMKKPALPGLGQSYVSGNFWDVAGMLRSKKIDYSSLKRDEIKKLTEAVRNSLLYERKEVEKRRLAWEQAKKIKKMLNIGWASDEAYLKKFIEVIDSILADAVNETSVFSAKEVEEIRNRMY